MSNEAIELSMGMSNCSKSWVAMTPAYVVLDVDFKKCCMPTGRYDGSDRDYYTRD